MNKRFKELREELNTLAEDEGTAPYRSNDMPRIGPPDAIPAADDVGYQAHDVNNDGSIDKLNWFVTSISKRSYMDPDVPMIRMKTKLNTVGLDFDLPKINAEGEYSLPLSQWGGRIGKDHDGSYIDDDGISHRIPGGLFLNLDVSRAEGSWYIRAKIENEPSQVDDEE